MVIEMSLEYKTDAQFQVKCRKCNALFFVHMELKKAHKEMEGFFEYMIRGIHKCGFPKPLDEIDIEE